MGRAFTVLLISFFATCVGCAKSPNATVSIVGVALAAQTDEGVVLQFRLDTAGTGDKPIALKEVKYVVSLDGKVVYSGTRFAEATVTEGLGQIIEIPAPIPADRVKWPLTGVRPYRISGSVAFLRPGPVGELLYDMGLKRKRARFAESGGLDFGAGDEDVLIEDQAADSVSDSASSESISDSASMDES
jgi:hypothetical protein